MKIDKKNRRFHRNSAIFISGRYQRTTTTHYLKSILRRFFFTAVIFIIASNHQNASWLYAQDVLSVSDFLPKGYVTDGSISYQTEIQNAIDAANGENSTLTFPPMIYRLDESGLKIHPYLTLYMYGAVFQLSEYCQQDGQVFLGENVRSLKIFGGEIKGNRDLWPEGINIRGIYLTGTSKDIHISDMYIHNLTSNGIGVFGTPESYARDIWISDVIIENCCNYYGDYLSEKPGPEKGSIRQDQGLIAFYYVQDFTVRGCRLEKSRSDGTHFYRCQQGQFVHNKVYSAQMGGYFLETCEDILGSDNIVRDNGSRGVTIERGSHNCILRGNLVANSGREGLWAPDCVGLLVTGNIFNRNGRKPNGLKEHQRWNANITINEASHDPTKSPTEDYILSDNIIYTSDNQVAAIRIDAATVKSIVVKNNLLRGEKRLILVEEDKYDQVLLQGNE